MANLHLDRCILVPTFHVNHEILNLRLVRSSLLLIQSPDQLSNDAPLGSHLVEQDKNSWNLETAFHYNQIQRYTEQFSVKWFMYIFSTNEEIFPDLHNEWLLQ